MRGHNENATKIADYLNAHPAVAEVFYPGLKTHPFHEVAKNQMKAFGGMLSFTVKGNSDDARKISNRLKLITRATSLGGVESLIEHRASMEGPDTKTPENLLRISVGLEFIDDLVADLEQALK
jgi:cystathionine gamma-synthase